MELLCIAHEGTPYGHVTVNGRIPTPKQLAGVAGVTEAEATKLLRELDEAGVFSRNEDGAIYCRRMVRDKAASDSGREFGKRGGNPSLKPAVAPKVNGGSNPGGLTPPVNRSGNPGRISGPVNRGPNLQEAEAEAEKKDSELRSGAAVASPMTPRDQLWAEGLVILRGLTGQSDRAARSFMGRLCKLARDDCAAVFNALWAAGDARPIDPQAWLVAAVAPRAKACNPFLDPEFDAEVSQPLIGIPHVH